MPHFRFEINLETSAVSERGKALSPEPWFAPKRLIQKTKTRHCRSVPFGFTPIFGARYRRREATAVVADFDDAPTDRSIAGNSATIWQLVRLSIGSGQPRETGNECKGQPKPPNNASVKLDEMLHVKHQGLASIDHGIESSDHVRAYDR